MTTPYEDLGVPPDATDDEIAAAYREQAKKHHPDAGGDHETFVAIGNAYAILKHPERRQRYDATGDTAPEQGNRVVSILCETFVKVLGENVQQAAIRDLVGLLRQKLRAEISEFKKKKAEQKRVIEKIRDILDRLTCDGPTNHLAEMMRNDLRGAERQINVYDDNIKHYEDAIGLAKFYVYRTDEQPSYTAASSIFYGSYKIEI